MNIDDIESFSLSDMVKFHDTLNPKLFVKEKMRPEVRDRLLLIAEEFSEYLGVSDLDIKDITVSGSNAGYTYTSYSDIDLHLLVDMSKLRDNEIYRELFDAKKNLFNLTNDIKVRGYDVELYVQDANQEIKSIGEYSILDNKWIKLPRKKKVTVDERSVKEKIKKLLFLIDRALSSSDYLEVKDVLRKLSKYRKSGLSKNGEFGPENIAYKVIRNYGIIDSLYKHRDDLLGQELSLDEQLRGILEDAKKCSLDVKTSSPEQLAKKHKISLDLIMKQLKMGIKVELEHTNDKELAREIALDHLSEDPKYYTKLAKTNLEENKSTWKFKKSTLTESEFSRSYHLRWKNEQDVNSVFRPSPLLARYLESVRTGTLTENRSIDQLKDYQRQLIKLDKRSSVHLRPGSEVSILQFVPHTASNVIEIRGNLDTKKIKEIFYDDSSNIDWIEFSDGTTYPDSEFLSHGKGGGEWDGLTTLFFPDRNNASMTLTQSLLMTPDEWTVSTVNLSESSGYIPSEAQKNDPRFKTALTVDVHPDSMKVNAKKLGWKIDRDGRPPLLRP